MPLQSPVKAAAAGYVIVATESGWNQGLAKHIVIDHGSGFTSLYAHLNEILVQPNSYVQRGQLIGQSGQTGAATGPVLYFEIRHNENKVDPLKYLP